MIVERVRLRSCRRRGAAIDVIADRARENRSQLVFTQARGRDVVFWQSPRTRKQARPNVRTPTARAHGIEELQIVVDSHEQYAYRFPTQQVTTVKRALPCGDYGIVIDGRLVASVERKSLVDLVASLTGGKLRYQVGELAALPRAAVVIEDRYSQLFKLDRVRPAVVADGLAELQIRWPNVPVVFCETRQLAEEWTYRFLAAAHAWAITEHAALQRISPTTVGITELDEAPATPTPPTARFAPGPEALGSRCLIAGGYAPRSGPPGTTPTHRTEPKRHRPVLGSTTRSGSTPVTRNEVCIKPGMPHADGRCVAGADGARRDCVGISDAQRLQDRARGGKCGARALWGNQTGKLIASHTTEAGLGDPQLIVQASRRLSRRRRWQRHRRRDWLPVRHPSRIPLVAS